MFVLFHLNIRLSINSLLFNQHWVYANVSTNVSTERTASEKRFPKMKRGLAGMIYLSYICTRNSAKGELSSAGSERLPYKQRVGGSNPSAPTKSKIGWKPLNFLSGFFIAGFTRRCSLRRGSAEEWMWWHWFYVGCEKVGFFRCFGLF